MFHLAECMNVKAAMHCSTKKKLNFKKIDYKSIIETGGSLSE